MMRRIRRSRHNKSKAIYVVFICFVTTLVFFFSVGYAVYSDRLLVGGRAYITSVIEGYSCHVKNIEGEVLDGLTLTNTIWDDRNGSVQITLNNISSETLEHFTILFEIPEGFEIQVRPRSGLAAKNGITVLNTPGTIDSDYRGELQIILINLGDNDFVINNGDRIAQIIVAPVTQGNFIQVQNLSTTERGSKGFGSTGV